MLLDFKERRFGRSSLPSTSLTLLGAESSLLFRVCVLWLCLSFLKVSFLCPHPCPNLWKTRLYWFECLLPESWVSTLARAWGRYVGSFACHKRYESQAFKQCVMGRGCKGWGCSTALQRIDVSEITLCERLWREERGLSSGPCLLPNRGFQASFSSEGVCLTPSWSR